MVRLRAVDRAGCRLVDRPLRSVVVSERGNVLINRIIAVCADLFLGAFVRACRLLDRLELAVIMTGAGNHRHVIFRITARTMVRF